MDPSFLQARIDACKVHIQRYEDAIDAISVRGEASYNLDTGQTKLTVTQYSLYSVQVACDRMLNRLASLEARRNSAAAIMRPAW